MNTIYKYIITGTITVISLFLMWYFSDILFYILISAVLSLIGKPLVDLLSKVKIYKFGFPKWLSATITLSTMWGVAILLLWFLVPIIIDKLNFISNLDIPEIIAGFNSKVDNLDQFLSNVFSIDFSETDIFNSIGAKITEYITPTLIGLRSIVDKTVILIIGAFSVSFITFFFLKESELFKEGVKMLFPHKHEDSADRSITSSINLLSRYFIGLLIESTIKLIVIAVLLTFVVGLKIEDSIIIALISAILNVIPYIGPIIGLFVGLLIAVASPELMASSDFSFDILKILLIFGIFQLVDNIIIQPYVYSSSVKAHPLEIFIVILMAGSIAGVTGMLLAIPTYTVFRVFAKEFFIKFKLIQKLTKQI